MANVTASITTSTTSTQTATLVGTVTPATVSQSIIANFATTGTGADSLNLNFVSSVAVTSAGVTLDLSSLTDRYGAAVNFARVRSVSIVNQSQTNLNNITAAAGTSNGWTNWVNSTAGVIIGPSTSTNQGMIISTNPSTSGWIVDGTHKTFTLTSVSAATAAVEINGANA
jgi:hypothetical protein